MVDLDLLWMIALAVAALVLLLLAGLLLSRVLRPLREASREARRLQLVMLLTKPAPTERDIARLRAAPAGLVADVTIELVQMVRGNERAQIIGTARRAGVPDTLLGRLASWSHGIRLGAAEALGDFVDDRVAAALNAALDDAIAPVRLAAAISLVQADRAPRLRLLIDKLELGTGECSRFILRLFRDRAASHPEEVTALLEDEGVSDAAKAYAAEALAAEGDYASVPAIASLVLDEDTDPSAVSGYVEVLGDLAHPGAAEAVEHALRSDDWQVRAAAASAAGKIRLSRSVDTLTELLSDRHWLVRLRAGEALSKLGEVGSDALMRIADSARGPAREAATIELAQRGA